MPISARVVVQSTVLLLAVGFLTLLVIVTMTIWLGERSQAYFDEVIEARDIRTAAVELRSALQTIESSQRGYIATGNEIYLAPYGTAKVRVADQLDAVKRLLGHGMATDALLRRLSSVITEKQEETDRAIALKSDLHDAEALAVVKTNRGKALMDEANVLLSGVIRSADDRLTAGVEEQRTNALRLRWASIIGAMTIVLVVAVVVATVGQYARELRATRDEVRRLNTGLEARVAERTEQLALARDRAEVLLTEVNHRVANSLQMVASLVKLQSIAIADEPARKALAETQARISAVGLVHRRLYSSPDVGSVALDEYLSTLIEHLATAMRSEGHGAEVKYDLEPLRLATNSTINLGVVAAEWTTNAFKYAYPDGQGQVRVLLKRQDGTGELVVEDDGVGRDPGAPARGTGLGERLVDAMAASMGARVEYGSRRPGTSARLVFPLGQA